MYKRLSKAHRRNFKKYVFENAKNEIKTLNDLTVDELKEELANSLDYIDAFQSIVQPSVGAVFNKMDKILGFWISGYPSKKMGDKQ